MLKVGSKLLLKSDSESAERTVKIISTSTEQTTVPVYNLEVATAHTFFVGEDGELVHNSCKLPRKPGSLGKAKGTDALRRENSAPRDAAKKYGLDKDQQKKLHDEISGEGYDYQDILKIAEQIKKGEI